MPAPSNRERTRARTWRGRAVAVATSLIVAVAVVDTIPASTGVAAQAPATGPVALYGPDAAAFGDYPATPVDLGGGVQLDLVEVPALRWPDGASGWFGAPTPGGGVLMGSMPQTSNQLDPTGNNMAMVALEHDAPGAPSAQRIDVRSVPGDALRVPPPFTGNEPPGGADVSDVCTTGTPGVDWRAVAISAFQARSGLFGDFPAIVTVEEQAGALAVAGRWREADLPAVGAFVEADGLTPDYGGLNECDTLADGSIAMTVYFGGPATSSGRLGVLDVGATTPTVEASLQLPPVTVSPFTPLLCPGNSATTSVAGDVVHLSPREIKAGPVQADGSQLLAVIHDGTVRDVAECGGDARLFVNPLQLFEYVPATSGQPASLVPASGLVLTTEDPFLPVSSANPYLRFSSVAWGPDGVLFAARGGRGGPGRAGQNLQGASMVAFAPGEVQRQAPPYSAAWWCCKAVAPTQDLPSTDARGPGGANASRSLDVLPLAGEPDGATIVTVGWLGQISMLRWHGLCEATEAHEDLDLQLGQLAGVVDGSPWSQVRVSTRQAAVSGDQLWIPVQRLQPANEAPFEIREQLAQHVARVDLSWATSRPTAPADGGCVVDTFSRPDAPDIEATEWPALTYEGRFQTGCHVGVVGGGAGRGQTGGTCSSDLEEVTTGVSGPVRLVVRWTDTGEDAMVLVGSQPMGLLNGVSLTLPGADHLPPDTAELAYAWDCPFMIFGDPPATCEHEAQQFAVPPSTTTATVVVEVDDGTATARIYRPFQPTVVGPTLTFEGEGVAATGVHGLYVGGDGDAPAVPTLDDLRILPLEG